jgi:hypothetical protein
LLWVNQYRARVFRFVKYETCVILLTGLFP